ncbi:MAG: hypothetical protein JXR75_14555 [Rhodobacteraceae bacterium]|nr:hypothetical protein [Paracoccaceae bacterium]
MLNSSFPRVLTVVLLAMALALPVSAQESIGSLDTRYEQLVRAEADLLADREVAARRAENRDLILFGGIDGPVTEMTLVEAAAWVDRIMGRIAVLGLDRVYLDALSPFEQMVVEGLRQSGLDRELVLDRLRRMGEPLRTREAENLAIIDRMLDELRADAEALQARREALRAAVRRGDGSDLTGPGGNPVCPDAAVPADRVAVYWSFMGSDNRQIPVKGDYICLGAHGFDLLVEGFVQRWECAADNVHDCRMNPDRTYAIRKRTLDTDGVERVWLAAPNDPGMTLFSAAN